MSAATHLRRQLLAGFFFLLPFGVSVWFFIFMMKLIDRLAADELRGLFESPDEATHLSLWLTRVIALVLTLLVLYLVGLFGTHVIRPQILEAGEQWISKVPFFGTVYRATRQISDALRMGGAATFRRCVLIEYPRAGIFTIAFVSNARAFEAGRPARRLLPVFLPTTPNPTSGFFLLVPEEDTIPLELSVEEGIKIIVSGGIFMPDRLPVRAPGAQAVEEAQG
ncbi:MAG: DUF502 domain-containing protein [Acidobacteria bacterium]|nr:DUF502 domain-containing protein [Acidobacteriota bacterium]